jgi:GT2 family glycosyltransferase
MERVNPPPLKIPHQRKTITLPDIPKKYPRIGIIIVTWNGKSLVLDCVKSLFRCTYPNFQILVVDNASTDGTVEALKTEFDDKIDLIVNSQNLMFAGGNNVGIRYLLPEKNQTVLSGVPTRQSSNTTTVLSGVPTRQSSKVDWILLLNNDVEVDPGLLDGLIAVGESDPNIGIIGPKIYFWKPKNLIWFAGGKISLFGRGSRHFGIRQLDRGQFDQIKDVDYVTGCALMIRRTVIEQIGLLDETYPMYNEDSDWCFRARNAGYRVVYTPTGKLWHKISASAGGQLSSFKLRNRLRSQWIFLKKYARWYHWLLMPFGCFVELIRILFLILIGKLKN